MSRQPVFHAACVHMGALACALIVAWSAAAQDAHFQSPTDPAADPPAAPAPDPNPAFRPGFIDALQRWLGDSQATLDSQLKSTHETLGGIGSQATGVVKDAAGAAQQATGVIVGLPNTRIVIGRQRCLLASNGAPDCGPAAHALCQAKGFGAGRGLDINSVQKCPAWMWLTGRAHTESECPTETFVTRAVCQ